MKKADFAAVIDWRDEITDSVGVNYTLHIHLPTGHVYALRRLNVNRVVGAVGPLEYTPALRDRIRDLDYDRDPALTEWAREHFQELELT